MKKSDSQYNYRIHTLDLEFMGIPGIIAAYLIPHDHGLILIECGPGSTLKSLRKSIMKYGYNLEDINSVLLTHIHLDHAGSAGALSRLGANIYVHHIGAPHLIDPSKLLSSAARIYGDSMDQLWGQTLAVIPERLIQLHDGDIIDIDGLYFRALDTPGHANHHIAYLFNDICFSGDIAGVRLFSLSHLRLPMPPPELHLERWRDSLDRLIREDFSFIAPTHYGIYNDTSLHLHLLKENLKVTDKWITNLLPSHPTAEKLDLKFNQWIQSSSDKDGLTQEQIQAYETVNPSWMSVLGIQRYWQKFRAKI
jgi:glyoxylase-like metal-dependent hydrolase (beta-lactamase superfamily II)